MNSRTQAIEDLQFIARRYNELDDVNHTIKQESIDYALKAILEDIPKLETERNALFQQNILLVEQNGKLKDGINKCYNILHG